MVDSLSSRMSSIGSASIVFYALWQILAGQLVNNRRRPNLIAGLCDGTNHGLAMIPWRNTSGKSGLHSKDSALPLRIRKRISDACIRLKAFYSVPRRNTGQPQKHKGGSRVIYLFSTDYGTVLSSLPLSHFICSALLLSETGCCFLDRAQKCQIFLAITQWLQ